MQRKLFLVTRRGFIYMDRCVHKISGITLTEKQSDVCEQRHYEAPLGGGSASQGRERQPSEAARSIWITL